MFASLELADDNEIFSTLIFLPSIYSKQMF